MMSRVVVAVVMLIAWEYSPGKAMMLLAMTTALFPRCYEAVPPIPAIRLRRLLYITALGLQLALLGLGLAFHTSFWATLGGIVSSYLCLYLYDHWLLTHLLRTGQPGSPALEANHE